MTIIIVVLALLVLALGGGLVYFILKSNEKTEQVTNLSEDKVELEQEIADLDTKVKKLDEELASQDVTLEEKEKQARKLMTEIVRYQGRVNQLMNEGKLQKDELDRYRGMYEQLEYYNEKYRQEIDRLQAENQKLREDLAQRDSTITQVDRQKRNLSQQVEVMQTQQSAAAILRTSDFRYTQVKPSTKEIENKGREMRIRNNTNMKFCFRALPNAFAPTGSTVFYAVVKGPSGIWKSFNTSSGYFTYQNAETAYSAKTTTNYSRDGIEVCITYVKPDNQDYEKGKHDVSIYANGYEIGRDYFLLK
jgi:myosin heavy subunit